MIRESENKTFSELKSGDYFYEFQRGRLGIDFDKFYIVENNSKHTLIKEKDETYAYRFKLYRAHGNVFDAQPGLGSICLKNILPYALEEAKNNIEEIKSELNNSRCSNMPKPATHVLNGIPCNVRNYNDINNFYIENAWTIEDYNHLLKLHNKQLELLEEFNEIVNTWLEDYVDEKIVDDYLFKINKISEIINAFVKVILYQFREEQSKVCPWWRMEIPLQYNDQAAYLSRLTFQKTLIPINEYKGEIKNHIYFKIDYDKDYKYESLVKQGILLSPDRKIDNKTQKEIYAKLTKVKIPKDYPRSRYSEILEDNLQNLKDLGIIDIIV